MYKPRPRAHSQLFNVACWKMGGSGTWSLVRRVMMIDHSVAWRKHKVHVGWLRSTKPTLPFLPSISYKDAVWSDEGLPFVRMAAIWPCLLLIVSCSTHKASDLWSVICEVFWTFCCFLSPSCDFVYQALPFFCVQHWKHGKAWGQDYACGITEACFVHNMTSVYAWQTQQCTSHAPKIHESECTK